MLRWKSLLDSRLPKGVRRKERAQAALDCRLAVETLEDRRMLAVVTVDSVTDVSDGVTTSIANLIAMPGDDNAISLREAIIAANKTGGLDNIEFNIAGGGVQTIQPGSGLPAISDPVILDGYTQAGSAVNTSAAGAALNTVLTVEIDGQNAGAANGLEIVAGGGGSTIRGLVINRFSGNGVFVAGATATGNLIEGNFIGTDADGTAALANGSDGVAISSAAGNTVGGTTAGARNLISGNSFDGVVISGAGATGNLIEGNFIGIDADGTAALANGANGVVIDSAAGNTVGGTAAGAGNQIAFNGGDGVSIFDTSATGNGVRRNTIFSNADLGIDIAADGVTSNDPADADTGGNNLQNFPQFVGLADLVGGMISLTYAVDTAAANAAFPLEVELFVADADGQEGQTFVATDTYSAADQAAGDKTIMFATAPAALVNGDLLVATATDALGNTSEFSAAVAVIEPGKRSVDLFLDAMTGLLTIRDQSGLPDGSIIQQDNDVTLTVGQFDTGAGNVPGLLVTDPFGVNALGADITQVSGTQAFVPETALTPTLAVDLQAGDDKLTVDVEGTDLITTPIAYNGGTGSDTLFVQGTLTTAVETVTYTPGLQSDEGRMAYDSFDADINPNMVIDFDNLEPVVDLVAAANLLVIGNGANNAITYTVGSVLTRGLVSIDGFETIEFANKATLALSGLGGDDTIVANNANLPTGLTLLGVLGGAGNDEIRLESLPDATTTSFVGVASAAGEAGNDIIDGSGITVATPLALIGGAGDDTLTGGAGPDVLVGDGGEDTLVDSPGADRFDGGTGNDTIVIRGTTANDVFDVLQVAPSGVVGDFYQLSVVNGRLALPPAALLNNITLINPALAPDDGANLPSVEGIKIEALAGDDIIRVGQDDTYSDTDNTNGVAAQAIQFTVAGDTPNASDQLVVQDVALGDTVIHRVGADGRSGSITVGALPPTDYSGIETTHVLPINPITGGTGSDGLGRLVVFKHDPFEANNTLANATFLGAGPTINVDPTIDPGGGLFGIPGDADFYQFVAQETGTLDFQLFFEPVGVLGNGNPGLPGGGELNATFFDNDGAPIAGIGGSAGSNITDGTGAKIGERITVPVVRNQTYFVRVQGDTATDINVYNFTAITVAAPVPELVDLQAASDSGRNNTDDITNITTPTFSIVLDDDRIDAFANLDLLPDTNDDNAQTANFDYGVEVFNKGVSIGFAFFTGGANNNSWQFTAQAGDLSEGDGNHISAAVWVRDRATPATIGRHDLSTALQVTLDTMAPPVSFGQVNATSMTDGLFDGSDTGVATNAASFGDRVTSDTTPTLWGRAEADSIVTVYLDSNGNGTIEPAADFFLGQTVATPLDGNNAFPSGAWEITASTDLNSAAILAALGGTVSDGARPLLVTAEDVAGNPLPIAGTIGAGLIDALAIFLDAQGPVVFNVSANAQPATGGGSYDLFDPKPSVDGPSPLINSITINLFDAPGRGDEVGTANDFLYPAIDPAIASIVGNYSVVGDQVGQVGIASVTVDQAIKRSGTITAVTNATNFTDAGLIGAAGAPAAGDFITFNNGAATGGLQRITAFNLATGMITVDQSMGGAPAAGDGFSVITAASLAHATITGANTAAQESVTGAINTTNFFAANIAAALQPIAVGDYIRFNTGFAAGTLAVPQIRRVTAFDAGTGQITLDSALPAAPVVGDGFSLISGGLTGFTLFAPLFGNTASVTLNFAQPLPDDRFTLTMSDSVVDPAGNKLDGESDADQPLENPSFFPTGGSGDRIPGGDFVARFTVDTRAEIGVWAAGTATVDTNGNFLFDPTNTDASNRDIAYQLGFSSDNIFAGNFVQAAGAMADGFDKLAAYGRVGNQWRWMIDTSNDGVPDIIINDPLNINGLPVAGNFDGNAANGDEVGVFDGTRWFFDTNHDFQLDAASIVVASYNGFPIVGDFDGNGSDDLGAYTAVTNSFGGNLFSIDTNRNGAANNTFRVGINGGGAVGGFNGFAGVRERPVAADMNADGIDDIGLWVPDGSAVVPGNQGEWYFLVSGDIGATAVVETSVLSRINNGFVAYTPTPFGNDIYATFGNSFAVPIVGNFDPPVVAGNPATPAAIVGLPAETAGDPETTEQPDPPVVAADQPIDRAEAEIVPDEELVPIELPPSAASEVIPVEEIVAAPIEEPVEPVVEVAVEHVVEPVIADVIEEPAAELVPVETAAAANVAVREARVAEPIKEIVEEPVEVAIAATANPIVRLPRDQQGASEEQPELPVVETATSASEAPPVLRFFSRLFRWPVSTSPTVETASLADQTTTVSKSLPETSAEPDEAEQFTTVVSTGELPAGPLDQQQPKSAPEVQQVEESAHVNSEAAGEKVVQRLFSRFVRSHRAVPQDRIVATHAQTRTQTPAESRVVDSSTPAVTKLAASVETPTVKPAAKPTATIVSTSASSTAASSTTGSSTTVAHRDRQSDSTTPQQSRIDDSGAKAEDLVPASFARRFRFFRSFTVTTEDATAEQRRDVAAVTDLAFDEQALDTTDKQVPEAQIGRSRQASRGAYQTDVQAEVLDELAEDLALVWS